MRSRNFFTMLISLFLVFSPQETDAQFWKKKTDKKHHKTDAEIRKENQKKMALEIQKEKKKLQKKKEKEERRRLKQEARLQEKKRKKEGRSAAGTKPPMPKLAKVYYPATTMKNRYRVDVLAPLYLDDLVKGSSVTFKNKLPEKAQPGISFYQGIKIAADSLKAAGFHIDLYIHDITSVKESSQNLVTGRVFDSSDLIIGAVPSKDVPVIAESAKKKCVNFVSALSPTEGNIKDNEYFTLIQPSLKTHCEWIIADVKKKFPKQKVVLLYRQSIQGDDNAYKYISEAADKMNLTSLLCNELPTKASIKKVIDSTRPNVLIVSILDMVFADSILKGLSSDFPAVHFEVYGMPSWIGINNLRKINNYPNLSIDITCPFNFDPENATCKYVERAFKRDYGSDANEFVYRGYETLFWYAGLLKHYGTIFNAKYADNSTAPFTPFDVKTEWDKDGHLLFNENVHVFLSTWEGGLHRVR